MRVKEEKKAALCTVVMKGMSKRLIKDEDRKVFLQRWTWLVNLIETAMPRRKSAAVGAAAMKCSIKYGLLPVAMYLKAFKNAQLSGADDPVALLWTYLERIDSKHTTTEIYRCSLTCIRAFCEQRKLTRIRPAEKDLFEWTEDWNVPTNIATEVRMFS